jgi:hypothetical protein
MEPAGASQESSVIDTVAIYVMIGCLVLEYIFWEYLPPCHL